MHNVPEKYRKLGQGFNTFCNAERNSIVDVEVSKGDVDCGVQVFVCNSTTEISDKLGIGGSVGVEAPSGSLQAKAEFLQQLSEKSNAVTILVRARRTWNATTSSAGLKEDKNTKEALRSTSALVQYAGDSYLSHVEVGLEYFASYQLVTSSTEERRNIAAQAEGTFGNATKVSVSLHAELDKVKRSSSSSWISAQKGIGLADEELPKHSDDFPDFANKIASNDSDSPALLHFKTTPYSAVGVGSDIFGNIKQWRDAYFHPRDDWFPDSIQTIEKKASITEAKIRAVISLYRFYGADHIDNGRLYHNADGCFNAGKIIERWKAAFEDGTGDLRKPNMDVTVFQIPAISFDIVPGFSMGRDNDSGTTWNDIDREFIYSFGYPWTITGRGGAIVDVLTTTYAFRDPSDTKNERKETLIQKTHGFASDISDADEQKKKRSNRGSDLNIGTTFQPNDVQEIGLWKSSSHDWPDLICGIEVRMPDSRKFKFGKSDSVYQSANTPPGQSFVGFQGRACDSIDRLQPVYVRFNPPSWSPVELGSSQP